MSALELFNIFSEEDVAIATYNAVDRALAHHESGSTYTFGNAESIVHTKGGSITYKDGGLTVQLPNLEPRVYETASGYPVEAPRPYHAGLLALLASNFQINSGKLNFAFDTKAFTGVFPKNVAALNPVDFRFVHATLLEVISGDKTYRECIHENRSLTGLPFWEYMVKILSTCSPDNYIALHDTVCKKLLQTVEVFPNPRRGQQGQGALKLGKRYKRLNSKQELEHIVPDTTVREWPHASKLSREWADAVHRVQLALGHRPLVLVGSIPTSHNWVQAPETGFTAKEAYQSFTMRRALHSSGSNGSAAVLLSNGFSSVSSNTANRCVMLLFLTVNALRCGVKKVDIRCDMNDVAYLERALPLVMKEHHKSVRYILDYSSHSKLEAALRDYVLAHPREDAHYVAWLDVEVIAPAKGSDVTAALARQWTEAVALLPVNRTIMMPITSEQAFQGQMVNEKNEIVLDPQIFSFRGPADFQAIYSTLPRIEKMLDIEGKTFVELKVIPNWATFLKDVIHANARNATWFLAPRPFFSSLSNLIRGIAKGTSMRMSDNIWEAQVYVDPDIIVGPYDDEPETGHVPRVDAKKKWQDDKPAQGGRGRGYHHNQHPKQQWKQSDKKGAPTEPAPIAVGPPNAGGRGGQPQPNPHHAPKEFPNGSSVEGQGGVVPEEEVIPDDFAGLGTPSEENEDAFKAAETSDSTM